MNMLSPRPLPQPAPSVDEFDVRPVNKRSTQALYKKREKIHPKRAKGSRDSTAASNGSSWR